MANIVAFYSDQSVHMSLGAEIIGNVLKHLGGESALFVHAMSVAGFESGVNWEDLMEDGVIAVVLVDVNDACAFGVSLEAPMDVYELDVTNNVLHRLRNLLIIGKESIKVWP